MEIRERTDVAFHPDGVPPEPLHPIFTCMQNKIGKCGDSEGK